MTAPRALIAVDFDGTLLRSDRTLDPVDLATLEALGHEGVVRVLATGRSLFSLRRALTVALPVDWVVFSCGAGLVRWPKGRVRHARSLGRAELREAVDVLQAEGLDFMVQAPIPDNHRFLHWPAEGGGPDFRRRLALYPEHAAPLRSLDDLESASQLIAILPAQEDSEARMAQVAARLPGLSAVRATSPIDGLSLWIELFPPGTDKGAALARLAAELGVAVAHTAAVGNDWNDEPMLAWTGQPFVVENAPAALRARFPSVASNDARGLTEAVARWRGVPRGSRSPDE